MAGDYAAFGEAIGPGCADVVGAHHVEHQRAGQPRVHGGRQECQHGPREHEVPGPADRALGERDVPGRRLTISVVTDSFSRNEYPRQGASQVIAVGPAPKVRPATIPRRKSAYWFHADRSSPMYPRAASSRCGVHGRPHESWAGSAGRRTNTAKVRAETISRTSASPATLLATKRTACTTSARAIPREDAGAEGTRASAVIV